MITLIAAVDRKGVIGLNGDLPWNIPSDLKNFKDYTTGKTLVMGRKTFESLPFLLKDRTSIVISSSEGVVQEKVNEFKTSFPEREVPLVQTIDSLKTLFACDIDDVEELVVVGGSSMYDSLYKHADKMVLSVVDADVKGDTWFKPKINWDEWIRDDNESLPMQQGSKDEYPYKVNVFYRKNRGNVYDFVNKKKLTKLDSVRLSYNIL